VKKKAIIYTVIFSSAAFILNFINTKLEKSQLKNLTYQQAQIYDFTLISKNSEKMIIKGDLLTDKIKYLEGKNVKAKIIKNKDVVDIKAEKAIFDKKNTLLLEDNVEISKKDLKILTPQLTFNTQESIAYNNTDNTILSTKMKTTGKDIFIDLKKEILKLKDVKTQIYGENNG
jgi:lipopolysaccharide assembly outer membrane protein LptD (OstA)